MKIIINTTNLRKGGAIQAASAILEDIKSIVNHEFHVFLSPSMFSNIRNLDFPEHIYIYKCKYPSKISLLNYDLNRLELSIKPDCVFSVFGPTYWNPISPHVMGFANGIHLYTDLPFYKKLNFYKKSKKIIRRIYHQMLLKGNVAHYIVETKDVKQRLSSFLNITTNSISVVSNSLHPVFYKKINDLSFLNNHSDNEFKFVSITSFYDHKNLGVINKLIPLLIKEKIKCKFVLTLPKDVFEKHFDSGSPYLINIGPMNIDACPYVYDKCDSLFLPTLAECFSVSYLEAMKMGIPILTSDYPFSRNVCGKAAVYFDPYDMDHILSSIKKITSDNNFYSSMVKAGKERLKYYPNSHQRTKKYIDICESITFYDK